MSYANLRAPIKRDLAIRDFEGLGTSEAGKWSPIAKFRIEDGEKYTIPSGKSYEIFPSARATFTGQNLASAADTTLANNSLPSLMLSPRYQAPLPSEYHLDVVVFALVSGVYVRCPMVAIDELNEAITFTEPAGASDIVVEYTHKNGSLRIAIDRQEGVAGSQSNVYIGDLPIRSLNARDQYNSESQMFTNARVELFTGFEIVLYVKSALPHVIDDLSNMWLKLQGTLQEIKEIDKASLRRGANARVVTPY